VSTKIEWVKNPDGTAGKTWNPITGCTKISPGCAHCYAERMACRQACMGNKSYQSVIHWRSDVSGLDYPGHARKAAGDCHGHWNGKIAVVEDKFDEPLHWRKPAHIFVCSMADLFHEDVPFDVIDRVFAVMAAMREHTFQVLTKRPVRMRQYVGGHGAWQFDDRWRGRDRFIEWPAPNVWLGVTAEDQQRADQRIPDLLATPAAVRFVSMEPLLGPVNLRPWLYDPRECSCYEAEYGHQLGCMFHGMTGDAVRAEMAKPWPVLDWVIVGGETGPGARPMHPDWVRDVRDQCVAANVPFFFKGWGSWAPLPEPFTYTPAVGSGNREYNLALGRYRKKHRATLLLDDRPEGWPPYMIRQGTGLTDGEGGMARVGKKAAGRLLDGREWNQMPGDQL